MNTLLKNILKSVKYIFILSLITLNFSTLANAAKNLDPENTLLLRLKGGVMTIKLRPDLAPNHVKRIKELTRQKFYDGIKFHRVIEGFMAQTGDPTGTGQGGSGKNIKAEFTNTKHVRGTVSMARANDPDSADSQFFLVFAPSPFLDGKYTVFGEIVSGINLLDTIKRGEANQNGTVLGEPDKIITLRVMADEKK